MSDELQSINYQLGKIVGLQEAMGEDISGIKKSIEVHQGSCATISGGLDGRLDKLETFNNKLTAKVAVVGVICGAFVLLARGLIVPVWNWFKDGGA